MGKDTSMSITPILFGTDGWRAGIAEEYTFENLAYCAQGTADHLRQGNDRGL
jgi:phosphomannomutase